MSAETHIVTTSDGSVLHYETHGTPTADLPSLVFLHYYGGSPTTYLPLLSQPQLQPFHKILYHARGWSPSTGPANPAAYTIPAMSSDLSAIIHATGVSGPGPGFVVVGHCMGGKVAQHYAATDPSPGLRGLVLVTPAPLRGLSLPPEAKAQQQAAYGSTEGVRFVVENVLTAGPGTLTGETMDQVVRDSMRGSKEDTAAWPQYSAEEDYKALEMKVNVPVLVLRGDKDFEREMVGELGVDLGWVNKTVEACGHLIPLEKPEELAVEVLKFVRMIRKSIR